VSAVDPYSADDIKRRKNNEPFSREELQKRCLFCNFHLEIPLHPNQRCPSCGNSLDRFESRKAEEIKRQKQKKEKDRDPLAPRDIKRLEESLFSDVKETELKKSFRLFSNQPGIPGTLYSIQVGKINGKWASRLLKGENVIASYVYKKKELGKSGFPKYKNIVGWVLKAIALPEIDPLQITNAIKALTTYSVDNKTLQRLRDKNRYHLNEKHRSDDDDDRFPYPYIYKPPKPPDDFDMAPQLQIHASPKDNNPDDETSCQYCGLKLIKEESLAHSCKKKPA